MMKIGILGGTGLDRDDGVLHHKKELEIPTTPFGDPSDRVIVEGTIHGVPVYIMGRHGKKHDVNPSTVNYRANVWSFKQLGVTHMLVTNAVGSLKKEIAPGDVAILDQYIDRTAKRANTMFKVSHIPQNYPFNRKVQAIMEQACEKLGIVPHKRCTIMVIEGPRYSTLAESKLYQSWGAHCVGMTTSPEAQLAAEAGMMYNSLALITDYDGWHEDNQEHVTVELVDKRMAMLGGKAKQILSETINIMKDMDWTKDIEAKAAEAQAAIMTL